MLGKSRPHEGWSVRDRGLAEALTEYEDRFCSGCGQRRDEAWDPVTSGHYEAHEQVCNACAAVDDAHKEHKEPVPGLKVFASLRGDFDIDSKRAEEAEARAAQLATTTTRASR